MASRNSSRKQASRLGRRTAGSLRDMPVWPFDPLDVGSTRVELSCEEDRLAIWIGVETSNLTRAERRRQLASPVELRITLLRPLVVFLLRTQVMIYDAPFSAAIDSLTTRTLLYRALSSASSRSLTIVFVHDGLVRRAHLVETNSVTWKSLETALRLCPETMSRDDYEAAVAAYQATWSPTDLLKMSLAQDKSA